MDVSDIMVYIGSLNWFFIYIDYDHYGTYDTSLLVEGLLVFALVIWFLFNGSEHNFQHTNWNSSEWNFRWTPL